MGQHSRSPALSAAYRHARQASAELDAAQANITALKDQMGAVVSADERVQLAELALKLDAATRAFMSAANEFVDLSGKERRGDPPPAR